ncbi:myosin binding protein Hb isoform X2 [Syngnathus typhle]|uniref:myosin binding protein Hb isoform X2 n=1 Tax=Syngnathus typhle TaxID=161592 RepID=UPI002A6A6FFE|nr:myosin binding protein Hb isoform X2 [Syngnathus typhle]
MPAKPAPIKKKLVKKVEKAPAPAPEPEAAPAPDPEPASEPSPAVEAPPAESAAPAEGAPVDAEAVAPAEDATPAVEGEAAAAPPAEGGEAAPADAEAAEAPEEPKAPSPPPPPPKDRPKVRLPRSLRQRYVANVGDKINLTIPFTGKPKPVVSWTKNGQPLERGRVNIRSTDRDSIMFIRVAERDDSGVYEMSVKVEDFEDKATLTLQIVELPGPPASVKIVDTWGFNVALEWTPPKDNGNTEITGYTIQKADKKTGDWFTVMEHYHRLNATISDLIMGNTYKFRVFSENKCGISEEAAVTKDEAKIVKTGIEYKAPEYQQHDFSEAPKFTTSLANRATTVGYSTKLLCSVRGYPKPKIEWLKNQMVIGDDPKFRQICVQGICSLEIRKPVSFDGGVYTCRAKNNHGEVMVSCKLEVRQPVVVEAEKK